MLYQRGTHSGTLSANLSHASRQPNVPTFSGMLAISSHPENALVVLLGTQIIAEPAAGALHAVPSQPTQVVADGMETAFSRSQVHP